MSASVEIRTVPRGDELRLYGTVNALASLVTAQDGGQLRLYGYDGTRTEPIGGGTPRSGIPSTGNYTLDVHSAHASGLLAAFRLVATTKIAAPTVSNCAVLIQAAGLLVGAGKALTIYASGGANNASLTSDAAGNLILGGTTGALILDGNVKWKSGTAFVMELDHTATADRVITVPDATDTLALLGRAQTFSATNTFSSAAPLILSASAARITGPFGDATRGNRPFFQASTNNNDTNVNAMPSGSNTIAKFEAYNNSTPGSATGIASLEANNTEVRLSATFASGSGLPLQVYAGGVKAAEVSIAGAWTLPAQPRCRAYNSGAFSHTSSGSWVAVTLDSERYDTASLHSTVSNTSRLTAPVAGNYHLSGCVIFAANVTGQRGVAIRLNGSTFLVAQLEPAPASGTLDRQVSCDYDLAASDYVELMAFQSSGGTLSLTASGNIAPEFSMRMTG